MPAFTTPESVRIKFQLDGLPEISPFLVASAIEQAHAAVLARIQPPGAGGPPEAVHIAETLLAGAAVLRSLAARLALERSEVRLAGHHVETGKRFPALLQAAAEAEQSALMLLQPFGRPDTVDLPSLLLTNGQQGGPP